MTQTPLPSHDALKSHARRLRATLAQSGTPVSHAAALEHLAHQWGYRDWNTLSDTAKRSVPQSWALGQRVSGQYLGHHFTGTVKSVRAKGSDHVHLTVTFDTPVDVVTSSRFSSLRRQVSCTIGASGRTVEKTSDGKPHMVLNRT